MGMLVILCVFDTRGIATVLDITKCPKPIKISIPKSHVIMAVLPLSLRREIPDRDCAGVIKNLTHTFLLRWNVLVCSYCGMTLAIKALRAAAWVSGAFLLETEAPIGLERASGSLLA
jgi:hypothetical protein